ncbi:hypothetical protein [Cytobacillus horneckiae]|uniref:hypothetical protein n=1 Tax=Cytobacillus horneckiae TaxID=549687 RepID=UPI003D9A963F
MESGGYEAWLYWQQEEIKKSDMRNYLCQLTTVLLKIDAVNLADNLNKHGEPLWKAFILLENNEIIEEEFYKLVALFDSLYAKEQERF